MTSDLFSLDLAAASGLLASRAISAVELTRAYLERVDQLNSKLVAYLAVSAASALSTARVADAEIARGFWRGPLQGIPIAVKDLFDVTGQRTTAGSLLLDHRPRHANSGVVERLLTGGAVLLGKLNLHEFAYGVTNENPHFGTAKNPWALDRITGGSSGGSAAAIAARLALGTIGSDTGGSIRIPAALCGVTGLKPTFGRVSLRGCLPLSWSNDHAGPLARSAHDVALMLQVIAGFDPGDPASERVPVPNYMEPRRDLSAIRIAFPRGYWHAGVGSEVLASVQRGVQTLCELGATVVEAACDWGEAAFLLNRLIIRAEAAAYHHERLETRAGDFGRDVLQRLRAGERVSSTDYALARRRQLELRRHVEQLFTEVDLVVTPTTRIVAPTAGSFDPVGLAEDLTAFTAPFNVTGLPAITVPCGFASNGLPVGLQLAAAPWQEQMLLQCARLFQSVTDWHTHMPPPVAEDASSI